MKYMSCGRCSRKLDQTDTALCIDCDTELRWRREAAEQLWHDGLSVAEIVERLGSSSSTVGDDLSRVGIGPRQRKAEMFVRAGRHKDGSYHECRSCAKPLLNPAPLQEFCNPTCARAYTKLKTPKRKKPPKTDEEREEARKRGLRKWYADQAAARREIFGWLKRQRAIKESEEE